MYAALWAGLTIVPLNARLSPDDLAYMVSDCDARVLCFGHRAETADGVLNKVDVPMRVTTAAAQRGSGGLSLDTIAEGRAGNIAAIVAEPIQGTGGVIPPAPGYLDGLQRICRDNEILLIVDEVITGFGRTGEMFATDRYGLEPDLLTFAKGVTSGYAPLGGVRVSPRIWERF
jgi:adenosylmethionine-8-amino-7-oxononanoate aminotransferase